MTTTMKTSIDRRLLRLLHRNSKRSSDNVQHPALLLPRSNSNQCVIVRNLLLRSNRRLIFLTIIIIIISNNQWPRRRPCLHILQLETCWEETRVAVAVESLLLLAMAEICWATLEDTEVTTRRMRRPCRLLPVGTLATFWV